MAELFGAILKALGYALNAIYQVIPSYGIAIILLTIGVRVILIPLTVKQIRSMTAMQKIQPQIKELQKKFKGDRQKLNEELMKIYKEHGVNPLGGCLPLIAQMPVFIALFSVLRASIPVVALSSTLVSGTPVTELSGDQLGETVCRPVAEATVPGDPQGLIVECATGGDEAPAQTSRYRLAIENPEEGLPEPSEWVSVCLPQRADGDVRFACRSALGTGHLPRDGALFEDVTEDRATFLSMHLGCSATQASSRTAIRQCTADPRAGGGVQSIPYYALVALIIGTSYYQARQMAKRATGAAAQQQQMMMKVMPVLFGFISLSIPAGTNVYFLVSNLWTIGQQGVLFRHQEAAPAATGKPGKQEKAERAEKPKPPAQRPKKPQQRKGKGKR